MHSETPSGNTPNPPNAGMAIPSGLYMTETYQDNATPVDFGNIINIAGAGTGQLLCEWSGDSVTGHLYYRSHRDWDTGGWGPWRQVMFSDDNSATATRLAAARNIQTNLGSTSPASFDGTENIAPGVTGTLPISNGGTGASNV